MTHDYPLNLNEEITAVATIILDSQSMLGMCFAVGSMYLDDMDQEPRRGRILLFVSNPDKPSLENSHGPYLLTTADVDGCVYAINNIAGKIVAAVNTGVSVQYDLLLDSAYPFTGRSSSSKCRPVMIIVPS